MIYLWVMTGEIIDRIKSIYGEILGIADHLPSHAVTGSVIDLYNLAIDRLIEAASESSYSRFKVTLSDGISRNNKILYTTASARPKMTAALSLLEYTYGFRKTQRGEVEQPTTIVTIHNNNQLTVTVIPIQYILERVTDEDLKKDIEELKTLIEGSKDKKKASNLLNTIQQKSWDIFIALLPVVLEKLGDH
jgi:hypothetical protein